MKKIIAICLSAAMSLTCGMNTFAAGRTSAITENKAGSGIQVLYNSGYLDFDDVEPMNVDGRVMIPFRAALEGMGAAVDFNNDSRLVTAKKGDTTITFTLLDTTIYIDDNGNASTITMDVPMIIENDRTLVPIRFMSEAFGMNVGWEDGTVLILDADDVIADLKASAPNMMKLAELGQPDYNNSQSNVSFEFTATDASQSDTNVKLDVSVTSTIGKNASEIKMNGDFSIAYDDVNINLENSEADIIVSGETIYIKTDAVQKVAGYLDLSAMSAIMVSMLGNSWFRLDIYSLLDMLEIPAEAVTMYSALLQNPGGYKWDENMLSTLIPEGRDLTYSDILAMNAAIDAYEEIDKFITVTETGNGYSINLDINDSAFTDIMKSIAGEEYAGSDDIDFNIKISADYGDKAAVSESVNIAASNPDGSGIKLDMTLSGTAEKLDAVTEPLIPESSIDILSLIGSV